MSTSTKPTTPDQTETTSSNTDESQDTQTVYPHRRVGSVSKTETATEQLDLIEEFIHSNPPETIGGNLSDTKEVKECLAAATDYYHDNLPDETREHITEKWGIADKMINAKKIGYVDSTSDVIEYLLNEGFAPLTIARSGIASTPSFKHLFDCRGISERNSDLIEDDDREDVEIDHSCNHSVPKEIDILVRAQIQGHIRPEEINLQQVAQFLEENNEFDFYSWWDERIVFPYKNNEGEITYFIARATDKTDDRVYDNGVTDRSREYAQTLDETNLIKQREPNIENPESFYLTSYRKALYNTPGRPEHLDEVNDLISNIQAYESGENNTKELNKFGIIPEDQTELNLDNTPIIALFEAPKDEKTDTVLTPTGTGINPDQSIELLNETSKTAEITVENYPTSELIPDADSETVRFDDSVKLDPEHHGTFEYTIDTRSETRKGTILAYERIYTENRNFSLEEWLEDEPDFNIDIAKYVKQTISNDWINRNAVHEPIFGIDTVHEGKPLLVTEGVTDAIMAHQYGFPCIAPATTNLKTEHFDEIPEDVSTAYMVNDNEKTNAGINGALRNAKVFENNGQTALVAELPRPENQDKIDLAEFLQNHDKEQLIDILEESVPPEEHPKFNPKAHDPEYQETEKTSWEASDSNTDISTTTVSEDALKSDTTSGLYSLELKDVIDWETLPAKNRSGNQLYRGVHPVQHHGNSENYFVIHQYTDENDNSFVTAKDYKASSGKQAYSYSTLSYLVINASREYQNENPNIRSVNAPSGSLSNEEVWYAWRYAKEADHIPLPEDDPIPLKAVWHIAKEHEVYPEDLIPKSFDDELRLTATPYNRTLNIIEEEYELEPGRNPR